MRCGTFLFVFLASCAGGPERGPSVRVSAADAAGGGERVWFRRSKVGVSGHRARLEADGGRVEAVVHSPDLATVSVLWREPRGTLRCVFPYGGVGVRRSGAPVERGTYDYVFLEKEGMVVTGSVPRGCPMVDEVALRFRAEPDSYPLRVRAAGGELHEIGSKEEAFAFRLPRNEEGALTEGDYEIVIETARRRKFVALLAIEPDGALAAVSGYLLEG